VAETPHRDSADEIVERIAGESPELVRDLLMMSVIRRFEELVRESKLSGEIAGSVHLCIGQEAVPVGVVPALNRSRDVVFATYRGHGWAIACGSSLTALFAELLGRADGVNGGRAGSAYLSDPSVGFMGENSIVGAGASHAVGAAMQGVFDGTGRRAVAVFGDGAMNQGAVHEAMNFAAFKRLPVLFVVENNLYSEMTPIATMVGDDQLWRRAAAYGIEGRRLDGNDTVVLRQAVGEWIQAAPAPLVLEVMTQRLVGHYVGDAEVYRPAGEVDALAEVEPISALRARLSGEGFPAERLGELEASVDREVQTALDRARTSDVASPDHARSHVYA
jgi:TPP-dependent pyruvate/acetoin dehydrogenase alpha subunit